MPGSWEVASDYAVDLKRWWASDTGQRYASSMANTARGETAQGKRLWAMLAQLEGLKLERAVPMYVTDGFCGLIEAAANTVEDDPALAVEDIVAPHGFAVLGEPAITYDRNGKAVSTRAISWAVVMGSGTPHYNADLREGTPLREVRYRSLVDDDEYDEDGQYGLQFTLYHKRGDWNDFDRPDRPFSDFPRLPGEGALNAWHTGFLPIGPTYALGELAHQDADGNPIINTEGAHRMVKWLVALYRLTSQRIGVPVELQMSRPGRKRAQRGGIVPRTLIVTLRRDRGHAQAGDHDIDTEWAHRWIVNGHWRRQWYPSLKRHRMIWIAPYVKGPEDKPLIVKDRAFIAAR